MKFLSYIQLLACSLVSIGCNLPPVSLTAAFWKDTGPTIGVAMNEPPVTRLTGIYRAPLALPSNAANTAAPGKHPNDPDFSAFNRIQTTLKSVLGQHGFKASIVKTPVDLAHLPAFDGPGGASYYASKDFRSLKEKLGVDRLLLIDRPVFGYTRRPGGSVLDSYAQDTHCGASGSLINLADNRILWHASWPASHQVADPWDQPPNFPNRNRALTQCTDDVRIGLLRDFFDTAPSQPGTSVADFNSTSTYAAGPAPYSAAGFALGKDVAAAEASCAAASLAWQKLDERHFSCSGAPVDLGTPVTVTLTACAGAICEVAVHGSSKGATWSALLAQFTTFSGQLEASYGDDNERASEALGDCTEEPGRCFAAGRARSSVTWTWADKYSVSVVLDGGPLGGAPSLSIVSATAALVDAKILALPLDMLRRLSEHYLRSLSPELREQIKKRLQESAH